MQDSIFRSGYRCAYLLLQVAVVGLFLGRGWQHLVYDAPFRALFFSEELVGGAVTSLFGFTWAEWARSLPVARVVEQLKQAHGFLYWLCAVFVATSGAKQLGGSLGRRWVVGFGGVGLLFLAVLESLDHQRQLGQFLEYSAQWGSVLLLLGLASAGPSPRALTLGRWLVALTFGSHGLYAVGFYELPGEFVTMVLRTLACSEGTAKSLLFGAGLLDFVVAAALLVGHRFPPVLRAALIYAAFWGGLTALARVVAFLDFRFLLESTSQWLFQTLVRLVHGALPLALFYLQRGASAASSELPTLVRNRLNLAPF